MESNIQQLRMQRWERIQKAGKVRFILIRGLPFGFLLGAITYLISPPPLPLFLLVSIYTLAGLAWGAWMWTFMMWEYKRAKNRPK